MAHPVPKVVVLLGPPGSGKGTQARKLEDKKAGYQHISTGDLFRKEINSQSALGLSVKDIIAKGSLVPDEVTNQVFESQVKQLLSEKPIKYLLLDGYPRTEAQGEFLVSLATKSGWGSPVAVELEVPETEVIERLSGRLVNPRNGRVYHVKSNPPKVPGICDEDGQPLLQRPDDNPETIRSRYKLYKQQRDGIVRALGGSARLRTVKGVGEAQHVFRDLEDALKKTQ